MQRVSSALEMSPGGWPALVKRGRLLFSSGLTLTVCLLLLVYGEQLYNQSLYVLSNVASILVLIFLALMARATSRGIWSISNVYLIIFSLFHFGLTLVFGLDLLSLAEIPHWFYSSQTKEAIILSLLALAFLNLGIYAAFLFSSSKPSNNDNGASIDHALGLTGLILTCCSIFGWFVFVILSGGVSLLFDSYMTFLDQTADRPMPYVYYGLGLGISFLVASSRSRMKAAGLLLFAFWSIWALPIGLRGEVLIPAAVALVIIARNRPPLSAKKTFVLVLLLLSMITSVKHLRQVGLQEVSFSELEYSPLAAVAEMGASLRPVSEVVLWHDGGDAFIYGASYWAPLERGFSRLIPWLASERLAAQDDERLMNVLTRRRVGAIGFSPVAEAYRNFGTPGVGLFMFLVGLVLGRMDLWPTTQYRQAAIGVILIPLLLEIRNAFTPVPAQLLVGLAVLGILAIVARMAQNGERLD